MLTSRSQDEEVFENIMTVEASRRVQKWSIEQMTFKTSGTFVYLSDRVYKPSDKKQKRSFPIECSWVNINIANVNCVKKKIEPTNGTICTKDIFYWKKSKSWKQIN